MFLSAFEKYAAIKIKLLGLKAPPGKGGRVYYNGAKECLFFGNERCAYCGGKKGTEAVEKCNRDPNLEYQ